MAREQGEGISRWHRQRTRAVNEAALGVDPLLGEPYLVDIMRGFERENVGLIGSIPERFHRDVETTVRRAWRAGLAGRDLSRLTQERWGVARSSANLIARDQTSKLNGQLARARQNEIGVSHYIWRTSQDERVRPSHRTKEARRRAWDSPPADTGHPGDDFQCRCTSEADFDSILEELEGEEPGQTAAGGLPPAGPPIGGGAPSFGGGGGTGGGGRRPYLSAPKAVNAIINGPKQDLDKTARSMFGQTLTDHEWAAFTGIQHGDVEIRVVNGQVLLSTRSFENGVQVYRSEMNLNNWVGPVVLEDEYIESRIPGRRIGTRVFYNQVIAAQAAQVSHILGDLVRSNHTNGYYTWATLGFDGVRYDGSTVRETISRMGEDWWRANGEAFQGVFDLQQGGLSTTILSTALQTRGIPHVWGQPISH